jgi:hypothetical protein
MHHDQVPTTHNKRLYGQPNGLGNTINYLRGAAENAPGTTIEYL